MMMCVTWRIHYVVREEEKTQDLVGSGQLQQLVGTRQLQQRPCSTQHPLRHKTHLHYVTRLMHYVT